MVWWWWLILLRIYPLFFLENCSWQSPNSLYRYFKKFFLGDFYQLPGFFTDSVNLSWYDWLSLHIHEVVVCCRFSGSQSWQIGDDGHSVESLHLPTSRKYCIAKGVLCNYYFTAPATTTTSSGMWQSLMQIWMLSGSDNFFTNLKSDGFSDSLMSDSGSAFHLRKPYFNFHCSPPFTICHAKVNN